MSRPELRIVRGEPSDEEVAALVAALVATAGETVAAERRPRSRWADRASLVRAPLRPGPGAWRASAW